MALCSDRFSVYVAFYCIVALPGFAVRSLGSGGSNVQSLLQPYDCLYYSGVRAYFGEEWAKAAELLERSIGTKDSLLRVRRNCHDECAAAATEAMEKLGRLSAGPNVHLTRFFCNQGRTQPEEPQPQTRTRLFSVTLQLVVRLRSSSEGQLSSTLCFQFESVQSIMCPIRCMSTPPLGGSNSRLRTVVSGHVS